MKPPPKKNSVLYPLCPALEALEKQINQETENFMSLVNAPLNLSCFLRDAKKFYLLAYEILAIVRPIFFSLARAVPKKKPREMQPYFNLMYKAQNGAQLVSRSCATLVAYGDFLNAPQKKQVRELRALILIKNYWDAGMPDSTTRD